MTDHEAELEKVCRRLESTKGPADDHTIRCLRNPDGPEAARLLREMAAENERLRGALKRISVLHGSAGNEANPNAKAFSHGKPEPSYRTVFANKIALEALTKGKPHD